MILSPILRLYLLLLLSKYAAAHFTINYPSALGDNAANEATAPCGGFTFSPSSTTSNFHVDGDAIALVTLHPQASILFRGTLDTTASTNWTNLFPVVGQFGMGAFCEPTLAAPSSWAGSTGLLQVIENSVDGILYQCAAVNFVAGKALSIPSVCSNGTGVSISFTSDPSLPVGQGASASASSSASVSATSPTSTQKASGVSLSIETRDVVLWVCMMTLGFIV